MVQNFLARYVPYFNTILTAYGIKFFIVKRESYECLNIKVENSHAANPKLLEKMTFNRLNIVDQSIER